VITINLLPARAAKKKENVRQQISIAILIILFVFFTMAWFQITLYKKIGEAEDETAMIKKEMEAMKVEASEIKLLKEKKDVFEKKFDIIKTLRENKTGPVHLMDDLSRSIPGFLWLTSFAQKEKTSEIELKGKALSNEAIAQFMDNLGKYPYFSNVNLTVSQQVDQKKGLKGAPVKNSELREFTITCQFLVPKGN
jgi:type IV pilus assembly protein PilN